MRGAALAAMVILASVSIPVHSQSAWLPADGELRYGTHYSFQTFDTFWKGTTITDYPFETHNQHTLVALVDYGVSDRFAIDATLGYTQSSTATGEEDRGLTDSRIGVGFRMLDEFRSEVPVTLTVRLGAIIKGTYDEGLPFSSGDGASGLETALLLGRHFPLSRTGLHGSLGYRYRTDDVPADIDATVGGYFALTERLTASLGLRHSQGLSGMDIGDPGFTFPELKEISTSIEGAIGLSDKKGRYYGLTLAGTVSGRNTGKRLLASLSFVMPH